MNRSSFFLLCKELLEIRRVRTFGNSAKILQIMSLLKLVELDSVHSHVQNYKARRAEQGVKNHFLGILATINGYHHHRVKPLMGEEMPLLCQREPSNPYDRNCFKVNVPSVDDLSPDILDYCVRSRPRETVRDIAGRTVGSMPAVLAAKLAGLVDTFNISKVTAYYVGEMQHGLHEVLGSGPKLVAFYFLEVENENVLNDIKTHLLERLHGIEIEEAIYL